MAASTSNQTQPHHTRRRYDVFLSFRGVDTRRGFTDHLYKALVQSGIHAFRDDNEIEYGNVIGPECLKAIEESKCSIVVLSKGYASSAWCLDELVHIIKCSKTTSHSVLPIFYDVDPSDAECQTGSFKDAFDQHIRDEDNVVKLDKWRVALTQVAYFKGIDLRNHEDGHEARNIEKIVKETLNKLGPLRLKVAMHPVDLDRPANEVISLLNDSSTDVGIVCVYGMGGIGKTTIAKKVYNTIVDDFDGSCFLENINGKLAHDPAGLAQLQRQLLSQTLRRKFDEIYNVDLGPSLIEKRLGGVKVVIVLDDVDKVGQLHQLIGDGKWLFTGSKVLITTRNKDFLTPFQHYKQYKVEELKTQESLQLLSLHAFGLWQPPIEYLDCAYKIVSYAGGIPLALQVLGSSLRGQGVDVWKNRVKKLEMITDKDIHKVLEVTYQSLDDVDKSVILDIACFFIGEEKNYVSSILEECGHFPVDGLQTLIRRCLISIGPDNELLMHDLLRDMGREIVRKESPLPGKRTRIWRHEDVREVLLDKMGEIEVEGLSLDKRILTVDPIRTETFEKMKRLRLLQLNYMHLTGSFHHLSKNLRWLRWVEFPMAVIPYNFNLENLVALDMTHSNLKNFPKDVKMSRLKFLNLSYSLKLMKLSEFECFSCLEVLTLEGCINLVEVHDSIGRLSHLVSLNLRGCISLKNLPRSLSSLTSLESLNVSGCSNLKEFSVNWGQVNVRHNVAGTVNGIVEYPTSQSKTFSPLKYSFMGLPTHSSHITNAFPSSLKSLNVSYTNITILPAEIGERLHMLTGLWLNGCQMLRSVPVLPPSLKTLQARRCSSLESIDLKNYLGDELDVRYCDKLKMISDYYKLETLQAETIKKLLKTSDSFEDDSWENQKIRVMNIVTESYSIRTIQALHENGIYSVFLPNQEIPSWLSYQDDGGSIVSLTQSGKRDGKIIGFIVAAVYGCDHPPVYDLIACPGIGVYELHDKNCWVYEPSIIFLPVDPEDSILWLSYWSIESFSNEGSSLCIEIHLGDMQVRRCGVHFVYEDGFYQDDSCNSNDLSTLFASLGDCKSSRTSFRRQSNHVRFSFNDNNEYTGSFASDDTLGNSLREHLNFERGRWSRFVAKHEYVSNYFERKSMNEDEEDDDLDDNYEISFKQGSRVRFNLANDNNFSGYFESAEFTGYSGTPFRPTFEDDLDKEFGRLKFLSLNYSASELGSEDEGR